MPFPRLVRIDRAWRLNLVCIRHVWFALTLQTPCEVYPGYVLPMFRDSFLMGGLKDIFRL